MRSRFVSFVIGILSLSSGSSSNGNAVDVHAAHVYYVSTDGSDSSAGAFNAPFRHIDSALAKTAPGDTVFVRRGIDGTGLSIKGKDALVIIRAVNDILFEGFDVCNYKSDSPGVNIDGILIDGGSGNIRVTKNRVYHLEHNVPLDQWPSGHGIEVYGNTAMPMTNILIEDKVIHDCKTGYSENLTINGYVEGFVVRGNTLYNCENIGIDAAGGYSANKTPEYNYARHGVISGNTLYHVESARGHLGGHGAIGIVSENNGYPTHACIVRNNFVYNNWRTGIYLGGYLHSKTVTDSCYVVNNTLYANDKVLGYYNEMEGEIRLTENCRDNTIDHNLYYTTRTRSPAGRHRFTRSAHPGAFPRKRCRSPSPGGDPGFNRYRRPTPRSK